MTDAPGLGALGATHIRPSGTAARIVHCCAVLWLLAGAVLAPSATAYMVRTVSSSSGDTQDSVGCEAGYNGSSDPSEGALFTTRAYPSGIDTPCPPSPFAAADGSTVTYSGTTDPPGPDTGRATFSTDASTISSGALSGSALAEADLSAGTLKALATSSEHSQSNAIAFWDDGLTFQIPGADANTVTPVGVHLELHGGIADPVMVPYSASTVEWDVHFRSASVLVTLGENQFDFVPHVVSANAPGWTSSSFSQQSPSAVVFDGVYELTGASPTADVRGLLQLYCKGGSSCDYSHSAALRLTLPPGVGYTSSSGVFLSAVPEPESAALMLAAGATLACMRRAQRRGHRGR